MSKFRYIGLIVMIFLATNIPACGYENLTVVVNTETNVIIYSHGAVPYEDPKLISVENTMNKSFRKAYCQARVLNPIYYISLLFGSDGEYAYCREFEPAPACAAGMG